MAKGMNFWDETYREKTGYELSLNRFNDNILQGFMYGWSGETMINMVMTYYDQALFDDLRYGITSKVETLIKAMNFELDKSEKDNSNILKVIENNSVIDDIKLRYAKKIHQVILNRLHEKNLLFNVRRIQKGYEEGTQ